MYHYDDNEGAWENQPYWMYLSDHSSLVFLGIPECEQAGLRFLRFFCYLFLIFVLSNSNLLFLLILSYYITLLSLRIMFSNKRQRRGGSG